MLSPGVFWPVFAADSAGEARRRLTDGEFDIIIINTPLGSEHGSQLAMDAATGSDASVLLLCSADSYDEQCATLTDSGVFVLPKPLPAGELGHILNVMCAARERVRRVQQRQISVKDKIEELRLVNRAKWLLIERLGMSEADAHHYIEKRAMDTHRSSRDVSAEIIKTYD